MKILNIKQSIGAVIITWIEIALAAACVVLFFFPIFTLLDGEMFQMVTLSQFKMLFGGSFECGQISNQTVNVSGNASFLVGFLVPMFMIVILYFRRIIRPFFAYLLHALISIALLFYLFTTCSVAGGIARENSDTVNTYQLTDFWYVLVIIVFVGLLLSILLVVFDIYRLKNSQRDFEEQEAANESSEALSQEPEDEYEGEEEEPEVEDESEDSLTDEEEEAEEKIIHRKVSADTDSESFNRSVKRAISEKTFDKVENPPESKTKYEPVAHISTEISPDELARNAKREADGFKPDTDVIQPDEKKIPEEKCTVKVKARVKPTSSSSKIYAQQKSNIKQRQIPSSHNSTMRKPTEPSRIRTFDEDFDENSGY